MSKRYILLNRAPAIAFAGGVVRRSDFSGKPQLIEIDHGGGLMTRYRHLFRRDVQAGDKVREGQVIGLTGHNTQGYRLNHMHFEMLQDGKYVDPEPLLRQLDAVKHPSMGAFLLKVGMAAGAGYLIHKYVLP